MVGFIRWGGLALGLCALPLTAAAHDSKRTDACGCHHAYGLRHCHPRKKTEKCEAPVDAKRKTVPVQRDPRLPGHGGSDRIKL